MERVEEGIHHDVYPLESGTKIIFLSMQRRIQKYATLIQEIYQCWLTFLMHSAGGG